MIPIVLPTYNEARSIFVIPATALSYPVGGLGAKFLLGEWLSPARWAGIVLVSAGVALVCAS